MTRTFAAQIALFSIVVLSLARGGGASHAAPLTKWKSGAGAIDSEATRMWMKQKLRPAPEASDAQILRRVTLDLIGRIPTPGEAKHYLNDNKPSKLERYVDYLLRTEDYNQHWADVYSSLLLGRAIRMRGALALGPREYLLKSFRANKQLQVMATELIASTGELRENGALGYLVGQRLRGGSVEQLAGTTANIFLGVQIQCAQCHDHPYDKRYKQRDFKAFTAFFGQTTMRRFRDPLFGPSVMVQDTPWRIGPRAKYATVTPRFLGKAVTAKNNESRRQTLARLITGSPLFAKAIVNRTWSQLFGRGIVSPWNDLGGETDHTHPALLNRLAKSFEASNYDHKLLLKMIVLSKPYRRAARGGVALGAKPGALERAFARAAVRPLTADQLFRSQLLATGITKASSIALSQQQLERRKRRALRQYLFVFGDDEMAQVDTFSGNVPQALLLRNGAITNAGSLGRDGMVLGRVLRGSKVTTQRLRWMFLAAYSRWPTTAETKRYVAYLNKRGNSRKAYEDLYFALITSAEFNSNH